MLTSWRYLYLEGTKYTPNVYTRKGKNFEAEPIKSDYYYNSQRLINPDGCLGYEIIGPDQIFPEKPDLSRGILERQLIRMCATKSNPLELERDARIKIAADTYLPENVRDRAFIPGFVSPPPPWYKRFLFE